VFQDIITSGGSRSSSPWGHSPTNQSGQFELTPSAPASKHHRDGLLVRWSPTDSLFAASVAAATFAILGSPMTRQILGRQSHTRHGSMDHEQCILLLPGDELGSKTYGAYVLAGSVLNKCATPTDQREWALEGRVARMPATPFTLALKTAARMMAIPAMTTSQSFQARPPLPPKSSWTRGNQN
jgi:hypothetical protein